MKKLKAMKEKADTLAIDLRKLYKDISERETKVFLPKLKKRFEGKYFRFRNYYSEPDKGWWLYYRIVKVVEHDRAKALSFQRDIHGEKTFSPKNSAYPFERGFAVNFEQIFCIAVSCGKRDRFILPKLKLKGILTILMYFYRHNISKI